MTNKSDNPNLLDIKTKEVIITDIFWVIFKSIPYEWKIKLADMILDLVENPIEDSENKYDDKFLVLTKLIRKVANIPD